MGKGTMKKCTSHGLGDGKVCSVDGDCSGGYCIFCKCSSHTVGVGESCSKDGDCSSGSCCTSGESCSKYYKCTDATDEKFAVDQAIAENNGMDPSAAEEKGQSLIHHITDTPVTFGLFGLLLASAAVVMIVRSYRRSTYRRAFMDDANDSTPAADVETNQALLE
jgi:hypothetical protein